jgi:4-amino-4-deoxy-L-arabinose transferase-like glycosyltransferase
MLLWTLVPALAYPNAPLDVVEIAAWGREWQWGYHKHPPLPAWLCEIAFQAGFRSGVWPIYLLSQLLVGLTFWSVWKLARQVLPAGAAMVGVVALEGTALYTALTPEFNHSVAVMPFFALASLCFFNALVHRQARAWILTGLSLGVGVWAKYSIGALAIAMALFVLIEPRARRALLTPGPWLGALTAVLVLLPHVLWLAHHDWVTLTYLRDRSGVDESVTWWTHLREPIESAFIQFIYILPAALIALSLAEWPLRWRVLTGDQRFIGRLLCLLALGPSALTLAVSAVTGQESRPIWAMPFFTLVPLALLYPLELRNHASAFRRALGLAVLAGVVYGLICVAVGEFGPTIRGKGGRIHFPGDELARAVQAEYRALTHQPLMHVAGDRWLVGNVSLYAEDRPGTFTDRSIDMNLPPELDPVASPWTSVDEMKREGGVLLWRVGSDGEHLAIPPSLLARFPQAVARDRPLEVSYDEFANLPPIRVGIAFVLPEGP